MRCRRAEEYLASPGAHNYFDLNMAMVRGTYENVKHHIEVFQGRLWGSFSKLSGKAVNGIDFLCLFMQLIGNVSKEAASGGEDAIIHISYELLLSF